MKATGIPHGPEPKRLPTVLRRLAEKCIEERDGIFMAMISMDGLETPLARLWGSFSEERWLEAPEIECLGLLLLAEILESAE